MSVDASSRTNVALVEETVFLVGHDNRLTVLDAETNDILDNRKLDRDVAAVCGATKNEITNRPAAWLLYNNGQLEKWEVSNGELNRLTQISVKPVFKERFPVVAAAAKKIAYVHQGLSLIHI